MPRRTPRALILIALVAALTLAVPEGSAQREVETLDPAAAQAQLERATRDSQRASARANRFAREAERAVAAADKAAREAAAIAAGIQRAEADIAAARARYSLAQTARARLAERLAQRQQPLVRLTSALQTTARRPLVLAALQPGSLRDLVHIRAVLGSAVPQIQRRTAGLRSDLDRRRALERRAGQALAALRRSEAELQAQREQLARLETSQRLASRSARSEAAREGERALALAEEARDLDGLVDQLGEAASLRRELAALPGPLRRPAGLPSPSVSARETGASGAGEPAPTRSARTSPRPPRDFQLPVAGRTLSGFGSLRASGLRNKGLTLGPVAGAQVVAPARGRVAFAGPYRGFGQIVIIEHAGGWTSVITGLDTAVVATGEQVIGGSPLGRAGRRNPAITFELRRGRAPVNPLQFIG